MEESPAPVKRNRTLKSAGLLILFLAAMPAVIFALRPPTTEPRTFFLHPDGQLSQGRPDGAKFPPSAISTWPFSEGQAIHNHFVLDAPPEAPASKWHDTIEQLATLGYASFQLRSAGETLSFHIADMRGTVYSTRTEPQWIDLRLKGGERPEIRQIFDVVVLCDDSITCGEIIAATRPYRTPGTSLQVTAPGWGLLRTRSEDEEHQPPKRTVAQTIRGILPF